MSRAKYEYGVHFAVDGDMASALERAAAENCETVSAITRRALLKELRKAGYLPDPGTTPHQAGASI